MERLIYQSEITEADLADEAKVKSGLKPLLTTRARMKMQLSSTPALSTILAQHVLSCCEYSSAWCG